MLCCQYIQFITQLKQLFFSQEVIAYCILYTYGIDQCKN